MVENWWTRRGAVMARINIEDSLWKDDRFQDLMIRVSNRHTAKGMLIELWSLAQEYWYPERKCIPMERIQRCGLELVIEVGLAEVREEGVFAVGADKAFEWLFERKAAGKKGGLAKASKAKLGLVKPSKTKQNVPSSSSSFSFSSSSSDSSSGSDSKIHTPPEKISGAASEGSGVREFIGTYCELWKARYKTNPEMGGKPAGIATRLVKNLGAKRACELVEAYLEMNDSWFVQNRHDLPTLEAKIQAVVIYADTGKTITQGELRQADKAQTNHNVWESLKRPEGTQDAK